MPAPSDRLRGWRRLAGLALPLALLLVAGLLIVRRFPLLDIFEDGYHHWWIGGHWAETGVYTDPLSLMTNGNWLPGYYPLVASVYVLLGWNALTLLRIVSLAATLATLVLVYRMASGRGRVSGFSAALLFGLAIQVSLIGSMAVPEPLVVAGVTAAVYLLWYQRAWSERTRLVLAAALLLAAATLRYEAWVAVALLPVHARWREPERFRTRLLVAAPAIAFAAAWTLVLLPTGFLPSIVFGQTAREAGNEIALGNIPASPWERLAWFWFNNYAAGLFPLFLLGPAYMVLRQRREYPTWVALALLAGVSVLVAAGLGTGSYRYAAIAVPFVAVASGRAVQGIWDLLRGLPRSGASAAAATFLVVLVVGSAVNTAWITPQLDSVGMLNGPLERAGLWISERPWPAGMRLLSDSPITTYYSHVDPAWVWSGWWLPSNRTQALADLRAHYAYLVYVNVTYYPLHRLFPELANGTSTADFVLVYNPNGWEELYGAKAVYVYAPRA